MTGFDIAVLLLIGFGAVAGFMRGFVQETLALAAWVIALFAIHQAHTPFAKVLHEYVGTETGASVLAFALLLLVPFAIVKALSASFGRASRNSLLGPIDRLLGFGFGAVKGAIIVVLAFSVLVLGYDTVWGAAGRPEWITLSRSYPYVNTLSEKLVTMLAERRQAAAEAAAKSLKKRK